MSNQQQNIYSALNIYHCESNKNLPQKQVQPANSNQNPRFDKNGDEIIWKIQKCPTHKLILRYIFSYGVHLFIIWFLVWVAYHHQTDSVFVIALFVFIEFYFVTKVIHNLNFKSCYLTRQNFVLQKYIGADLVLPMGGFYLTCGIPSTVGWDFIDAVSIYAISKDILPKYYFTNFYTNIDEAMDIIKPHIENYCIKIDESAYLHFKNSSFVNENKENYIDFAKIDKLRKVNNGTK